MQRFTGKGSFNGLVVGLAILLIIGVNGCGGGGGSGGTDGGNGGGADGGAATPSNGSMLTGIWKGKTWLPPAFTKHYLTFTITQNGTDLSGTVVMSNVNDTWTGTLTATVTNPTGPGSITMTVKVTQGAVTHQYTFLGDVDSATYMHGNWCNANTAQCGGWNLGKQ